MISIPKLTLLLVAGFATIVVMPTSSRAQTESPQNPQAMRLLQQACDYIKQPSSYGFRADIVFDEVLVPDFKVQYHATSQVIVRRPGELRVDYRGDRRNVNFYYNGKTFGLLDKQANTYASLQAPATIDSTLTQMQAQYDIVLPLEDFIYSDPYKAMASKIKAAYYLGPSRVAGVSTQHLAFSQEAIDWQIWIEEGQQPLPRKLVITYKNLPGSPQYSAVFSKWVFKPFDASIFSFTPASDTTAIEFLPISPQPSLQPSPQP
jgi:hypothetical protein